MGKRAGMMETLQKEGLMVARVTKVSGISSNKYITDGVCCREEGERSAVEPGKQAPSRCCGFTALHQQGRVTRRRAPVTRPRVLHEGIRGGITRSLVLGLNGRVRPSRQCLFSCINAMFVLGYPEPDDGGSNQGLWGFVHTGECQVKHRLVLFWSRPIRLHQLELHTHAQSQSQCRSSSCARIIVGPSSAHM